MGYSRHSGHCGCICWLPTSEGIITALEKIVKAFEDTIQVQLIKERWEEIKSLQYSDKPNLNFATVN